MARGIGVFALAAPAALSFSSSSPTPPTARALHALALSSAVGARKLLFRFVRPQAGFALADVVLAMAIIGLGLAGVSAGFVHAVGGVEMGRQQTTATFLAEQRLEQVRGATFAAITAATFPAEGYDSIAGAGTYRRTVTITDNPGGAPFTKRVDVSVFYRPVMGWAVQTLEREVRLSTAIVSR